MILVILISDAVKKSNLVHDLLVQEAVRDNLLVPGYGNSRWKTKQVAIPCCHCSARGNVKQRHRSESIPEKDDLNRTDGWSTFFVKQSKHTMLLLFAGFFYIISFYITEKANSSSTKVFGHIGHVLLIWLRKYNYYRLNILQKDSTTVTQ
jgi:hypothetical protein